MDEFNAVLRAIETGEIIVDRQYGFWSKLAVSASVTFLVVVIVRAIVFCLIGV